MDYSKLAIEFVKCSHYYRRQDFQRTFDEAMSGELFTIFYILYQKDAVTPGMIAKEMEISSARVAAMLNNLEKKEYIKRVKSQEDKRKIHVILTQKGIDLAQKTKETVLQQVTDMLEFLGPDDAQHLIRIMGLLAHRFKETEGKTC